MEAVKIKTKTVRATGEGNIIIRPNQGYEDLKEMLIQKARTHNMTLNGYLNSVLMGICLDN
jgi:hypothetical protein